MVIADAYNPMWCWDGAEKPLRWVSMLLKANASDPSTVTQGWQIWKHDHEQPTPACQACSMWAGDCTSICCQGPFQRDTVQMVMF